MKSKDDVDKTKKSKEKIEKVPNKKKKIIIATSIVVILIAIISVASLTLFKEEKEDKEDNTKPNIETVSSTINLLANGEYYIFGAPQNQSFEVTKAENFSYEVTDEDNKKVDVIIEEKDNIITIKAPKDLYEQGKEYTLKITNGTFVNEELKEGNIVVFSVVRKASQKAVVKDDVKVVEEKEITVKENNENLKLTSENDYKVGDIIYIENESAYKIEKVNINDYDVSIPTLEEVFSEYDFYGEEYLSLEDIAVNDELKEYVVAHVEKDIIDLLIPEVNAAPKISTSVSWNEKKEALVTKVSIATNPGEKLFNKKFLNNHSLGLEITSEVKLKAKFDVSFEKTDIAVTLETVTSPKIQLTYKDQTLDDFQKITDGIIKDNITYKKYEKLYKEASSDNVNMTQMIGDGVEVPTSVPGLKAVFNIGLLANFDVKANATFGLKNTSKTTIGYSNEKGLYSSNKSDTKLQTTAGGKLESKAGLSIEAGTELLNLAELKATVDLGVYGENEVKFTQENESLVYKVDCENGYFIEIGAKAKALGVKLEATLFEKKFPINKYEDEKILASEEEKDEDVSKDETVSKEETTTKPETNTNKNNNNNNTDKNNSSNNTTTTPTYRYTAKEVRQKLINGFKQYAPFSYFENGNSPYSDGCGGSGYIGWCYTTKMNTDSNIFEINNKFGGVSDGMEDYIGYTCYYNYVNDTLSCTNYSNAKSKLQSLCQQDYDDYHYYKNQGLDEGDYGYGLDYNTVSECFNYLIGGSDSNKNYYKTRINKILQYAGLTQSDLGVLK